MKAPYYQTEGVTLYQGEALALLRDLPDASVDALVTDPPYSSGGFTRGDRMRDPEDKYRQSGGATVDPDFAGDNRDQRAYLTWCSLWMSECLRVAKPGALIMVFTDWRQLPTTTDAIQCGGWVWRGIFVWDKGEGARGYPARFRNQCEFVAWGTRGGRDYGEGDAPHSGVVRVTVKPQEKHHLAGKPVEVMRALLAPLPPGSIVLDPFMGSGSTLVAAQQIGLKGIGFELSPSHVATAARRLQTGDVQSRHEAAQASLFAAPA